MLAAYTRKAYLNDDRANRLHRHAQAASSRIFPFVILHVAIQHVELNFGNADNAPEPNCLNLEPQLPLELSFARIYRWQHL